MNFERTSTYSLYGPYSIYLGMVVLLTTDDLSPQALDGYVDKYELQSFVGVPSWLKSSQLSGAFHLDS